MQAVPYHADLFAALDALVARCRAACPAAKLMPAGFYAAHPALAGGQNLICARDDGGQLVGFAPLFPVPAADDAPAQLPHTLWTVLVVDPDAAAPGAVRDLLFAALTVRAQTLARDLPPRRVRLAADLLLGEQEAVADLAGRGFSPFAQVLLMARATDDPLPEWSPLPGVTLIEDRLADADTQAQYLAAYNLCFPRSPKPPEALDFLLGAPVWAAGFAVLAKDAAGALVGSVIVYGTDTPGTGMVDDVFVLPLWRGRGLARRLIAAAVRLARKQGLTTLRLEVDAANAPAAAVYRAVGFAVVAQEVLLGLDLPVAPPEPENLCGDAPRAC